MLNTYALNNWLTPNYKHVESPSSQRKLRPRVRSPPEIESPVKYQQIKYNLKSQLDSPRLTQEQPFDESQNVTRVGPSYEEREKERVRERASARARESERVREQEVKRVKIEERDFQGARKMLRSMVGSVPSTSNVDTSDERFEDELNSDLILSQARDARDADLRSQLEQGIAQATMEEQLERDDLSTLNSTSSSDTNYVDRGIPNEYLEPNTKSSDEETLLEPTRWMDIERDYTSDDDDEGSVNYSSDDSDVPLDRTRASRQASENYLLSRDSASDQSATSDTSSRQSHYIERPNVNLRPRHSHSIERPNVSLRSNYDNDISTIDNNVPPTNIGHTTMESLRHNSLVNDMQQNTSSLRNDMYRNNFNNRRNTKILMENLNDFPLASELYKNKRITTSQASNKEYMEQIENELRESKKSIKRKEISRKGDPSRNAKIQKQNPVYRYEASTRPILYKGLIIYTPPHASRPTYSNDPRKWGAGHAQHGEGILMDAITDGVQLAYSSVSPIVNGANWVRNKMEGNGRCHPNSRNCWGGRKIYPDSLSDFGTILGL